jgi:3-deoxy-D-manno-octulosonic-acid transferase
MSAKSFRSHRKTGLIAWALRKVSLFAVQTDDHAARLRGLGVDAASIHVTGNMKYDLSDAADGSEERRKLRSEYDLGDDMPVWIGGSIHRGEDEALAWAQSRLAGGKYALQLVIVPRYPADAPAIAGVFKNHGLKAVRKTELDGGGEAVFSDPRSVLIALAAACISAAVTRAATTSWSRRFSALRRCSGPTISVSRKPSGRCWTVMPDCSCTTRMRFTGR